MRVFHREPAEEVRGVRHELLPRQALAARSSAPQRVPILAPPELELPMPRQFAAAMAIRE